MFGRESLRGRSHTLRQASTGTTGRPGAGTASSCRSTPRAAAQGSQSHLGSPSTSLCQAGGARGGHMTQVLQKAIAREPSAKSRRPPAFSHTLV